MCVLNFMPIRPVGVKTFHSEPKMSGGDEVAGDHRSIRIYYLGTMNVYTKCHGNPSNSLKVEIFPKR